MSRRALNGHEITMARQVFRNTLPYAAILINDTLGCKGLPHALNFVGLDNEPSYVLHVGPVGFSGMHLSSYWKNTLIHELTHVWQSRNSNWPAAFIFNSIGCHIGSEDPYQYTAGAAWDAYNVEQQASIVEDWFGAGQQVNSPLYQYIANQILKGKPAT
jgi:hypothetical protein